MKIKKRLLIAFFVVILLPVLLGSVAISMIVHYQVDSIRKDYKIDAGTLSILVNPVQVLNRMTEDIYNEIKMNVLINPEQMENLFYIDTLNGKLAKKYSFLIVRKDGEPIYVGDEEKYEAMKESLPKFGKYDGSDENGIYMGSRHPYLIKRQDFYFRDGKEGSIYLITVTDNLIPQLQSALIQMGLAFVLIMCLTAVTMTVWIYRGIVRPIGLLRKATNKMMEGDLEYSLMPELKEELNRQHPFCKKKEILCARDELGMLCEDFEKMRNKMRETTQKRVQFEEDQRELISNISHDLKTPLTAIKGYTEGIMDGVAETPEKRERYLKTIYTKANDMTVLVDELSFYSGIDCNTIPYEFAVVNAKEYFKDCVGDIGLDLEVKGINLAYFYFIEDDVEIVADAEKLKRVINNVVNNSVKYMDKEKGTINIRVKDAEDYIEVEMEDNGKGIPKSDISNIFDRFYRSDTSRNSRKGGSGLGLAISRKIIEDHGGKIWATSRENVGTSIFFTLCKARPNMVMHPHEEETSPAIKAEKRGFRLKKGFRGNDA